MLVTALTSSALLAGISGPALQSDRPLDLVPAGYAAMARPVTQPAATAQSTAPAPPISDAALEQAIAQWQRLQQSDGYRFNEYAAFLLAHPGWPGETSRRAAAEAALDMNSYSPDLALRYFDKFPPVTASGRARYAVILQRAGKADAAREQARKAWHAGVMRSEDEALLLSAFSTALRPVDHDARMDELLWQGASSAAARELPFVSPAARPVLAARLAFRTDSAQAGALDSAVTGAGRHDAGFIADRAAWLRNNGQSRSARAFLAEPHHLSRRPGDAEEWFEVLLDNAQAAVFFFKQKTAYEIAHQVDDAYHIGTDVSTRPLGERDDYTSLVWLAGTVALEKLNRPADAMGMFERYARASQTPQTRSKGLYWAGRAAQAAGKQQRAQQFLAEAAGYPDLYYGQLATERLGHSLAAPSGTGPASIPAAVRQAWYDKQIVRAAQLLGKRGNWKDQGAFVRQIAASAETDADHALAYELSKSINRPDLAVMVGRSARREGLKDFTAAGYPTVGVPGSEYGNWTMIHAIARQESQFDTAAISYAGARGLMQLMPGTAREAAGKLGLAYSSDNLTTDPQYNIRLGSSYIQRMLSYYGGSYPLAVAAYNAGPGNVNKWIAANGDPRLPSVDMVKWIEEIPIYQTKNYVQRVLENAVVYDLLNPKHAISDGPANLSWYLGKNKPG
ncbi:lytic transglycosylase domain-containing protein [Stakelama saccharophila]